MTGKRSLENRVDRLDENDCPGEIFVVSVGGDPDAPRDWMSKEDYREHYGDAPSSDSDFCYNLEWGE